MKLRNAALSAGVSAAALLAAQGVMAGSLKDPVEPMPITTSWHGFYVGAHIGAGEAGVQGVYDKDNDSSEVRFDRMDLSGVLGGGQIGYNFDLGHWVVGVEADVSAMDWFDHANARNDTSDSVSEEAEGEMDLLASVRGRIGVPVGDDRQGLLYATGGVAFPDAQLLLCEDGCWSDDNHALDLDDMGGVIGAGFEWAATDKVRVRFETLYYMFDDEKTYKDEDFDLESTAEGVGLDDAWTVRLGASWYLNGNY